MGDLFKVVVFAERKAGFVGKFAAGRRPPGVPAGDFEHRLEQVPRRGSSRAVQSATLLPTVVIKRAAMEANTRLQAGRS